MSSPIAIATVQATIIAAISNVIAQVLELRSNEIPSSFSTPDFLRFVIFTLLTAPPNYLWQHALERLFPARKPSTPAKPTLPCYEDREHDGLIDNQGSQQEEELVTKLDWKNTVVKWLLDCMTLGALLNVTAFIILMSLMKGRSSSQIGNALRTDTFPIIYASYRIWPLASVVNFTLIPVERRIVFLSLVGLIWGIYLSLTAAKQ
ncbi:putative integral membrane protein, Mpv17/PMP22 family [Aureobasidium namibiae CBS 147.97]|uniref:Putative integral membrane protein, Mpv17/PMP22 family n=1 Tax=Aureobasidium namibiae CBS 147.97 TaxID=1043004 RepID=A0A074WGS0_9PEZI